MVPFGQQLDSYTLKTGSSQSTKRRNRIDYRCLYNNKTLRRQLHSSYSISVWVSTRVGNSKIAEYGVTWKRTYGALTDQGVWEGKGGNLYPHM